MKTATSLLLSVLGLLLAPTAVAQAQSAEGGTREYVIPGEFPGDPLVQPEGIVFDDASGTYFTGAFADGAIYRGNLADDQATQFLPPLADGRVQALGLDVDGEGRLYIATGLLGTIDVVDIATGTLEARFLTGPGGTINDIAVTPNGDVYATDSTRPTLFRISAAAIDAGSGEIESIPLAPEIAYTVAPQPNGLFNANGIVAADDRTLIVAQTNTGKLFRIVTTTDPDVRDIREISVQGVVENPDGLALRGTTLSAVDNLNELVVSIELDEDLLRGGVVAVTADPSFITPTGVAIAGDRLLVSNSQIFSPRGAPFTVSSIPDPAPEPPPDPPDPVPPVDPDEPVPPDEHEPDPDERVVRIQGETRLDTAVAVSAATFENAETAVLARVDDFPDALAAGGLAAEVDAPILLTPRDALDQGVGSELDRLGVATVYLAGGEAALSEQVRHDVEARGITVERIGGSERFETAALIAAEIAALGGPVDQAVLALGSRPDGRDAWPDAVTAGNLAAIGRAPVLLTAPDALPGATVQALAALLEDGDLVFIAGGQEAVGAGPEQQLDDAGYDTDRLAGSSRYGTAVEIVEEARRQGATVTPSLLASGDDFAEALVAVPAAHHRGGVLLIVAPRTLDDSTATRDFLVANAEFIDRAVLVGGQGTISEDVEDEVRRILD